MGIRFLSRTVFITTLLCSTYSLANTDPLIGKWKTVDDRTGHSLADVIISKNQHNVYSAQVIEIRSLSGKEKLTTCQKCTGHLKNQPMIGLTILSGLKKNPEKHNEYIEGKFLDPLSGQHYVSEAHLVQEARYLQVRAQETGSSNVRLMTWIKVQ
ncbi:MULTISPECIES: DUF2147 domain-containing protein [Acinetobacter]|uniref:DUF2147 domain-containing protein n=1 Tax=Acinetobacter TaxID=469 RepID=UPI000CDC55F4|nr:MULTISPECIES: DUF2147 domain-containing protein [unclassified Acinetobacter]AUX85480.1 DUF2147 domain-containing protein [Acinetobacter sp. ACNIH2]UOG17287.1 DUF2147 domain-containing protein [Acinetobacter sp. PK01]